jgi:Tat protein secretion system quality control protein TatD with DNase activity
MFKFLTPSKLFRGAFRWYSTKPFIDTHTHIDFILQKKKMSLPQLKSLFGPNYKACITVCCTKDSFEATDEMIASNPDIYAAYGNLFVKN